MGSTKQGVVAFSETSISAPLPPMPQDSREWGVMDPETAAEVPLPPPTRPVDIEPPKLLADVFSRVSKNHLAGKCTPCRHQCSGKTCPHEESRNFCHYHHSPEHMLAMQQARIRRKEWRHQHMTTRSGRTGAMVADGGHMPAADLPAVNEASPTMRECKAEHTASGTAQGTRGTRLAPLPLSPPPRLWADSVDLMSVWARRMDSKQVAMLLWSAMPKYYDD